ncbi:MAG: 3-hydroxyacyl-ACP dehydratase [Chitinophagales bacterium]|nr:3-hydroxyacyl-ACP dehydratase [Chitinophagales bacterium]
MLPVNGTLLNELIPQKPPFVLISMLHEVSEHRCVTTFRFSENHVLCSNGCLTAAGLLENIAQTCAVKVGYECYLVNKKVPLGFIGDIKDFRYARLPLTSEEIRTEITIEHQIFDVTLISGKVSVNGEEIASCKMKIFVEPEEKPVAPVHASK